MCDIFHILFEKLRRNGLMPVEIPRFGEDVSNIVNKGRRTLFAVNRELEKLGWRRQVLDETTFNLIMFFLKNGSFSLDFEKAHS